MRAFQKGENKERKNKRVETSLTAYGYGFGRRTIEESCKGVVRKASVYPKCFSVMKLENCCTETVVMPDVTGK